MHQIQQYFKSYDFSRGLLMAFTMLVNGLILYFIGLTAFIPAASIGILLTSSGDLQGDLNKRVWAMLFSIGLNAINFIIINSLMECNLFQFAYIGFAVFFVSYLGVFGHRANMLAFSGLMGIVLSMVKKHEGFNMWEYVIFLMIGGLCYITFSTIFHFITKKRQVNEKLLELIDLTSEYIEIQWNRNQPKYDVKDQERLNLHQQITERQEDLRDLLFTNELFGGASKTRNRQMLLLVELIDISELATANPINVKGLRHHPDWDEDLFKPFQQELYHHAQCLKEMAASIRGGKLISNEKTHKVDMEKLKDEITQFAFDKGIEKVRPITLALLNYHDYLEKQLSKIDVAYHLVKDKNNRQHQPLLQSYREKFIKSEDYSLRGFRESFKISSPVMRHSIRLTIAMVGGYFIGWLLNVENAYWIMLTVVVIMRPSYGLTKSRSIRRVSGTILGAMIAILVVWLTSNFYIYLVLALISMVFSFSLINRNYFLASTAITLNVIFAFALMLPDQWGVIQYRFIDTMIGAVVCTVVAYTVLPYWEVKSLLGAISDTLTANQKYIQKIIDFYKNPSSDMAYRLSRKQAFVASGELNAAFERFTQDPKSRQANAELYYDWIVVNQNFLEGLANLGSYIQNHHSADIKDDFENALTYFKKSLHHMELILNDQASDFNELPHRMIESYWEQIEQKRNKQLSQGIVSLAEDLRLELQEVKHIKEQLKWLEELNDKLHSITLKIIA